MSQSDDTGEPVTTARITRSSDSTPLGMAISLTGPDLVRLGIDPVQTDVVDVYIEDGALHLAPGEGEPVITERTPPSGVKERWVEFKENQPSEKGHQES